MRSTILFSVLAALCTDITNARNISEAGQEVVAGNNRFTLDLYKILGATDGNVFFSPFSVSTILGVMYMMANGETADEVARALHVPSSLQLITQGFHDVYHPINNGAVTWANKAFIEKSFNVKQSYVENIKTHFNTELSTENFKEAYEDVQSHINSWISDKTHGRISVLLNSDNINENTKMVLVSTIYFKGKWHHSIRPEVTREENFYLADSTIKPTQMMTLRGNFGYSLIHKLDVKVLLIPYKDFKQNMIIILPNKVDGLSKLEEEIMFLDFHNDIVSTLHYTTMEAVIPKFKLEHGYELKSPLQKLGVERVFNAEISDFSNAVDSPGLEINSVEHKTYVEVNEEGTFAAAATGAVLSERADIHDTVPVFEADHPFIFAITDGETKSVLFFGRYSSPP